jgi:transcription initiation factor TFIIIB Brf1 subunit/transcription initiation factor TFIIB
MNLAKVTGRRLRKPKPNLLRHSRKCRICKHPRRAEIEFDFLVWRSLDDIRYKFGLAHHSAIYRHAHALGLTTRRLQNARMALDYLVERVERAPVTGNTIIRAIRAYSCLSRDGQWTELPKHVIFETRRPAPKAAKNLIANPRLENAATS